MKQFDFPMTLRGGPVASTLLQRQAVYLPTDRAGGCCDAGGRANLSAAPSVLRVLRVLQGADAAALARSAGVTTAELERWREEFLAGALSRMG